MLATVSREASIEYTTVLPQVCIDELKRLSDANIVPSVSQGIRMAIESFIAMQKKHEYASSLKDAARDKAFVARTMDTQHDFAFVDDDGVDSW